MEGSSSLFVRLLFHLNLFVIFFLGSLRSALLFLFPPKPNLYLSGNFAPVKTELFEKDLKIEAKDLSVLDELEGEFVRNGPNPKRIPKGEYHWFDGDGMLHGVRIKGRKVNYVNRWVRTKRFVAEENANDLLYLRFGEMSGLLGLLGLAKVFLEEMSYKLGAKKIADDGRDNGTSNTALTFHDGRLLSLVESDYPYAIRLLQDGQLETIGRYSYEGKLRHPFTAHPKIDAATNELMFIGYSFTGKPAYCSYSVVNSKGELVLSTPIEIPKPVMIHDFGITENYSLIFDLPLEVSPKHILQGGFLLNFVERPSRIGVIDRFKTKGTRWFDFEPGYFFHIFNSWEEENQKGETEITVIGCRSRVFDILNPLLPAKRNLTNSPVPHLYRMNLTTGEKFELNLSEIACEFPTIHPERVGKANNQFAFCATFSKETHIVMDGFVKFDLSGLRKSNSIQEVGRISLGSQRYAGEGVFVPRKNGASEDDGFLLTFVFNEKTNTSEFVVFDAKTMSNEPLVKVVLPQRVPYGFHGIFVTEEQLVNQKN